MIKLMMGDIDCVNMKFNIFLFNEEFDLMFLLSNRIHFMNQVA